MKLISLPEKVTQDKTSFLTYAKQIDRRFDENSLNLDNFEKLHNFIYQRALTSVIVASVKYRDDVVDFFDKYMIKNPQVLDPVKKALETLDIRSKFLEFMK